MKRTFSFLAVAAMVALSACHPEPILSVSPDSLSFSESGGSQTVQISANYPWTASVSGSGFSVSPSSGEGNGTVTVTAAAASSPDAVTGSLSVRSEGLSASVALSQSAKPTLILGDGAKVPAEGGSVELQIQYNTDYIVEVEASAQSWIKFIKTKSLSSGKLEFEISPNEGDERSGKVTVKDGSGKAAPVTATITQAAETKVLVVGDAAVIPSEGATVEVDVKYNVDYAVEIESAAQSWIHYVETKAVKEGKLVFKVDANVTTEERSGTVTLKDKSGKVSAVTITFNQKGETAVLVVGDVATVPAEGATVEVDVQYNVDYEVIVDYYARSWVHYIETKTVTEGKLVFQVDANPVAEERAGKVTLMDYSGKVSKVTITFEQEKGIEVESIELDSENVLLEMDGTRVLTATVKPDNATYGRVEWTSADPEVATVDENGKVTAVSRGITLVTARAGNKAASCTVSVCGENLTKARMIMERVYEAWGAKDWKEPWIPGENWPGLSYNVDTDKVGLRLIGMGLKGEIPECIGDLGDMISYFAISDEPGLTGSLPGSFANLVALESIGISRTSIQFVPDVFTGMPLVSVDFQQNEELFCPLPYSLGDSPALVYLHLHSNRFTGELPASWARLGEGLKVYNNCLTGKIPQEYIEAGLSDEFYSQLLWQRGGYGFDVTDIDIPGRWNNCYVKGEMKDLKGETFTFDDVIKKNKYTVFLNWAPWCPFSKDLMPALRDYYEKYRQDGLEVIATVMFSQNGAHWSDMEGQVKEVEEKGYGQWYNFYFDPELKLTYVMHTPAAEIYDSDGNIVFSSFHSYIDPVRKRFGKTASSDLIPFLETVFGPAEAPDPYTSTDYSKDGEVLTLQKATVGKGIDIVFMGDAYTDRDMDAGGLYETVMKEAMEEFFGIEPYRTFRDRFNVYAVKVVSPNGRIGADYTTALGVTFGAGTSVRGNDGKAFEYAMKVPSITDKENLLVCVMMNTRRHAGTAALHSTLQSGVAYTSTYANDRSLFGPTLRHEAGGHGFAFLADEYSTHNQSAPAEHIAYYNEVFEKYGWYSNVDFTDDPSKIRWSAFLSDERYKDEVGIFEGGALYSKGAYRPSKNGMMNESMEYHNAPSRWAIYRQIMKRSGEECSFEKFLEYDAVNRGKAAAAPRPPLKAAAAPKRRFEPTAPPVILP